MSFDKMSAKHKETTTLIYLGIYRRGYAADEESDN